MEHSVEPKIMVGVKINSMEQEPRDSFILENVDPIEPFVSINFCLKVTNFYFQGTVKQIKTPIVQGINSYYQINDLVEKLSGENPCMVVHSSQKISITRGN